MSVTRTIVCRYRRDTGSSRAEAEANALDCAQARGGASVGRTGARQPQTGRLGGLRPISAIGDGDVRPVHRGANQWAESRFRLQHQGLSDFIASLSTTNSQLSAVHRFTIVIEARFSTMKRKDFLSFARVLVCE